MKSDVLWHLQRVGDFSASWHEMKYHSLFVRSVSLLLASLSVLAGSEVGINDHLVTEIKDTIRIFHACEVHSAE